MKKQVDITEELHEMAIFLKNKFTSKENLLANGLEGDYKKMLTLSGSFNRHSLLEEIDLERDNSKAKKIAQAERNCFRYVPILKHKPKKVRHGEAISKLESEIIDLAEQENLRVEAKRQSDNLSFFKRKLAVQTRLVDPGRLPGKPPARHFDSEFLEKYKQKGLGQARQKMRQILLGNQTTSQATPVKIKPMFSLQNSPKTSEKSLSTKQDRSKSPLSQFHKFAQNRVYHIDPRPASEGKLTNHSGYNQSKFALFSHGNIRKDSNVPEKSEFSKLNVRDYAVDHSLEKLHSGKSLRMIRSAVSSGGSTPKRNMSQGKGAVSEYSFQDKQERVVGTESSNPEEHTWTQYARPTRPKNLTSAVIKQYNSEQQTKLLKRLEVRQQKQQQKMTILGGDASLHEKKQLDATISELERVRLAAFHQSRWVNELAYPSRKTDNFGMKDITADVSSAIDKVIELRVVGEVLDRSVRYHFYKTNTGKTFLAYSKDHEVNSMFKDMHRSLVPLDEVTKLKGQFAAGRDMIDHRDSATINKDRFIKGKVLQLYSELEKDTIPGILNFELADKIAQRFFSFTFKERSGGVQAEASQKWKVVQTQFAKIVDFKYLVGASLEDIVTFGLTRGVKMPSYKTIGIFDAVRGSSIKKYQAVCARDRFLKFCNDEDGKTPLIRAVESSRIEFIKQMLKDHQPVNHIDNHGKTALYYAIKRGEKEIVESLLLHRARFEDNKQIQYSRYLEQLEMEEICYYLRRVVI